MKLAVDLKSIQSNAGVDAPVSVADLVGTIVKDYAFYAAGTLLLVYAVSAGIQMMTAKGDPKAMQAAQGKITTAVIGFVIVILAYFIVQLLGNVFGLGVFSEIF